MLATLLKGLGIRKVFIRGLFRRSMRVVLDDVTLGLEVGKTLGLVGPSGSGKTTLARILAGLEIPTIGQVEYKGQDIRKLKGRDYTVFRHSVQMIFQDAEGSLNPRKSVRRSFDEVLDLMRFKEGRTSMVQEVLETVGLSGEVLDRRPSALSGGQNQRVVLARALVMEPEVLILDEPTSALDVSVQAQILHLLRDLQRDRGIGYLLISHHPEVVRFMARDVAVLREGRITHLEGVVEWDRSFEERKSSL